MGNYVRDEAYLFRVIDSLAQISQEYAYSANGKVKSQKDAGSNVTTYEYDEFDRLNKTIYPDLSDEVLSYDAAGNLLNRRNRALQNIAYTYDPLNRRDTKTLPGEPPILYSYDLAGLSLLQIPSVAEILAFWSDTCSDAGA